MCNSYVNKDKYSNVEYFIDVSTIYNCYKYIIKDIKTQSFALARMKSASERIFRKRREYMWETLYFLCFLELSV